MHAIGIPGFWFSHTFVLLALVVVGLSAETQEPSLGRYIMYLTGQHNVVPEPFLVANITHVALAFMRSEAFNDVDPSEWPLFTTVSEARSKFAAGTKIMVAIGGWGNTDGFSQAAKSEESRELFAKNVGKMIKVTGADGVDIDWEYPGGNGEDYKTVPNSEKAWEIEAYPKLLANIRKVIGPSRLLSAAVPGLPRDMLAFTPTTVPLITAQVDFLNIMTYDLFNRRDNITKHHTGLKISLEAINAYLECGLPATKANLGLAYYVKWYKTAPGMDCSEKPVGCKTALMEDPKTGGDLGQAGAFSWHDPVPAELATSFALALEKGVYDEADGGHYFWDKEEERFWTWDTPDAIKMKFPGIVEKRGLGGVFAWGLGEDGLEWQHLKATNDEMEKLNVKSRREYRLGKLAGGWKQGERRPGGPGGKIEERDEL
ncbi:glycoside hydrolase family 18 protein [Pleomassaria siparia CBS 279.74]|uniref:chitinase n=1 Tax=Pleomassaria siparia CBS 279.74 TaxID=1314801 RepID=A0A6G1KSK7_9PLEO|nr:glycoside hydrolase family 18 protein [Pleomassaria siparia CBS 279.74]